ncbi:exocyst subunit [Blastocladiella emersonii ATCC 22665]|nr:exocyst subunit [Blastocladiella emersonii ATCC 22665]
MFGRRGAPPPQQSSAAGLPPKSSSRSRDRIEQYRQNYGDSVPPSPSMRSGAPPPMPGGGGGIPRSESGGSMIPLHRDLEDLMNEVRINWPFMMQEDFQEVQLALQLLEGPGGRSVRSFQDLLARLEPAVETVVNDYHSSFNFSVQYYSDTLDGLNDTQDKIRDMKEKLLQSRENLQLKQFDLLGLWNKNLVYKEMLRIMDMVDEMRRAPFKIESLVAGKYCLSAVSLLNQASKLIQGKECAKVGALDETRKQLTALRESIFEAILNDINNHIYLKSPFAEDRWTAFVRHGNHTHADAAYGSSGRPTSPNRNSGFGGAGRGTGPRRRSHASPLNSISGLGAGAGDRSSAGSATHHRRIGSDAAGSRNSGAALLSIGRDTLNPAVDGGSLARSQAEGEDEEGPGFAQENGDENPEIDSLGFITLCLEALTRLGALAPALAEIKQRVAKELFLLVERCIVDAREEYKAAQFMPNPTWGTSASSAAAVAGTAPAGNLLTLAIADRHALRDTRAKESRFAALRGLCTTLFAKLEAVVEGHKLTCNMVDAMSRHPAFEKCGNPPDMEPVYTIEDIGEAVHDELQTVLLDYLRTKGSSSEILISDLFKPPAASSSRPAPGTLPDGSQPPANLFKFSQSESFSSVAKFYRTQLPPLPPTPGGPPAAGSAPGGGAAAVIETHVMDRYASVKSVVHTPLFDADPEFVCVVYRPTCDFFTQLASLARTRATYSEFLDEFILTSYIPSIEAKVQAHVHKYINGPDGFVVGDGGLLQSAVHLMSLIQSLCATMWQVPFRSAEYLRMIEDMLARYVERCFAKYRHCVSGVTPDGRVAESVSGTWARNPDLLHVVCQNTHFHGNDAQLNAEMNERYNVQEILMQARLCNDRSFQRSEIVFDKKKLELLAYLRVSLKWFRDEIIKLMETKVEDAFLTTATSGSADGSTTDLGSHNEMMGGSAGPMSPSSRVSGGGMMVQSPTSDIARLAGNNGDGGADEDELGSVRMLHVPAARAERFKDLLEAYQALADSCLVTLHLEVRVHAMYHTDLAMREGNYFVEGGAPVGNGAGAAAASSVADAGAGETVEPELYILQLNTDLGVIEELCLRILPTSDATFVFDGVGLLLTHYLVANVRYLRRLNHAGVRKMVTSIRALHQHLLHADLCRDVRLDHARRYYELYLAGATRMLDDIADHGATYTLDEYRNMLDFMYDVATLNDRLASDSKATAMAAAKAQREHRDLTRRLEDLMKGP